MKFVPVAAGAILVAIVTASSAQSTIIPTQTGLRSSANPAAVSQALTLTARVSPGSPSRNPPTGTLQFFDANVLLGSAALVQVNGVATATLKDVHLEPGSHALIARYPGDANFGKSDSVPPLPQRVTAP